MKPFNRFITTFILACFLAIGGCASTTDRQAGEYVDDTVITTKVKSAILNDPLTKVTELNVETYKGEAQLSGFVSSQEAIDRAIEVTRSVDGVTSIKNDMEIKHP